MSSMNRLESTVTLAKRHHFEEAGRLPSRPGVASSSPAGHANLRSRGMLASYGWLATRARRSAQREGGPGAPNVFKGLRCFASFYSTAAVDEFGAVFVTCDCSLRTAFTKDGPLNSKSSVARRST